MKAKLYSIFLLILIILICFGNSLFNGFVYDDRFVILNSPIITSFQNLPDLFSHSYFLKTVELSYRPVVTFSYFIDYFLWGKTAFGYHLTNLLIHILNSIILFLILCELMNSFVEERDRRLTSVPLFSISFFHIAIIPTLFFAIHPVTTEAINSISYREDLLATLFVLLSFFLFILFLRKRNSLNIIKERFKNRSLHFYIILSLISFFFAVFSKESAIVFPLLLFLIIKMKLFDGDEGNYRKSYFCFIPILLIFIFYIFIRFYLMNPATYSPDARHYNLYEKLLNFFYLFNHNLRVLIIPLFLRADYVFNPASQDTLLNNLIYIISFLLYGFLIFYFIKRNRIVSFGLLWIFISLLPVSNFIPLINPIADRYLYFPSIGISFIIMGLVNSIFNASQSVQKGLSCDYQDDKIDREREGFGSLNKSHYSVFLITSSIILLWYFYLTVNRNIEWSDEKLLWKSNLKYEPNSLRAYNGLALIAQAEGDIDKAIEYLKAGLDIKSNDIKMLNNLGVMYMKKGEWEKAIDTFQGVLNLDPKHPSSHYNLFHCYLTRKPVDLDKAKYHLGMAESLGYPITVNDKQKIQNQ